MIKAKRLNFLILPVLYFFLCTVFSYLVISGKYGIWEYVILSVLLFVLGGLISFWVKRSKKNVPLILIFALLSRLVFLFAPPALSGDVYRYLWEGKVCLAGQNPFDTPPSSPKLKYLRDKNWEKVEHKNIPTIYPPLSQFVFLISAYISSYTGNQLAVLKALFFLFELGIICILYLMYINRSGIKFVLLYAFHPLSVLEISLNAHVDVVMIFFLVMAIYFKKNKFSELGIMCIILGALSKIIVLMLLPFFVEKNKTSMIFLFSGVLLFSVSFLPFYSEAMLTGLSTFTKIWAFNSPVYKLASYFTDADAARIILLGLFSLGYFYILLFYKEEDYIKKFIILLCLFFILSPVLHPWYLLTLLVLLSFRFNFPVYVLTLSIFASYEIYSRWISAGIWQEKSYILITVWLPFYASLGYLLLKKKILKRVS
jgi:hypothetical protein